MPNLLAALLTVLSLSLPAYAAESIQPRPAPNGAAAGGNERPDLSMLTTDEVKVYQYGEISTGSLVGGGLLGTFVGLGLGHIVYGEYGSRGWIFTVGELGSLAIASAGITSGVVNCSLLNSGGCSNSLGVYTFGILLYFGFRVWEIIDVWTLPSRHNDEYHAIEERVQSRRRSSMEWNVLPIVAPSQHQGLNLGLGLAVRY